MQRVDSLGSALCLLWERMCSSEQRIDCECFHVYLSHVRRGDFLIFGTRLGVVIFLTTAGSLRAADPAPAPSSDGYKTVTVDMGGGKSIPIRVKEAGNPYQNMKAPAQDGKYHPSEMNFSAASPMAEKKFTPYTDTLPKGDPDFQNPEKSSFITKSYTDQAFSSGPADLNAKAKIPTTNAYSRSANGLDKAYTTSSADAAQNKQALFASAKSTDQDRTAILGGNTQDVFASPLSNKTYMKAKADGVQHKAGELGNGVALADLPNRPLTIDEVRNLINHGFKPGADTKPDEASKPLNDPNYKPEPLRDMPSDVPSTDGASSPPASDDDKSDSVPPPGTMSAPPENSEPLPQP